MENNTSNINERDITPDLVKNDNKYYQSKSTPKCPDVPKNAT